MGEISFSEICGLARALEPHVAGARPRERVPLQVRDRDDRVVERRLDMRLTVDDVLLLPPPCLLRLGLRHLFLPGPFRSFYFLAWAFLRPAIVFLGPLRVRAFVWVRCPRT